MTDALQRTTERVQDRMDEILTNFKAGVKITVLVRSPDNPNADFCMTSDDLNEVIAMVRRRKGENPAPQTLLTETTRDTMRTDSDADIERWAATRADDAGFLARKFLSERYGRWLPITTAPKDGTRIWIYYPTTAFKTGKPGLGTKTEDAISLVGYWREAPSHEGGGYWTTDYNGKEKRRARATYWQKLPAPPALDAAVRGSGS